MGAKRLFLSCVTNEFGSYRSVLADALSESGHLDVEKQETFRAYGDRTLLMLDEYIRSCDYVVHIAGSQTGTVASPADRKPLLDRYSYVFLQSKLGLKPEVVDSLSYTQWEAWLAVLHGRRLFICAPADNAVRDADIKDPVASSNQLALQQQHLRLLEAQGRYAETSLRFVDQNSLSVGLLRALHHSSQFGDSEKIVPKGLLQFDESAAGFYLKLLPPPYWKNGIPEIVQHWKTTLESDPSTISTGVLLGVSGSGKSSLFRAGVVPLLDRTNTGKLIEPVFFQAGFRETEQKLQVALRSKLRLDDSFPQTDSLDEFFNCLLTSDHALGRKIVVIVDQFEQWLQFWDRKPDHDLIRSIKRCKNSPIQFILIVREEFFSAIHRFMESIGEELTQKNYRVMQAFDLGHAKNVLLAFGQAYNCVGTQPAATELQFIDNAVKALANMTGNEVVCVRLSMFADMMRSRKWTMANWKEVGGVAGLGVKFLRQKFDESKEHRFIQHRDGVREVLRCLLPERGVELKTQVPISELQKRSGYSSKETQFKEMMNVLEDELRIVTSSDSEGDSSNASGPIVGGSEPYYQLAHDFLVTAVREWLSLTQKSTPGGRAMLLLESRSAAWHLDDNHTAALPSMREYLAIRYRTQKYAWSDKQRVMMAAARKQFRKKLLALVIGASLLIALSSYLLFVFRRDLARQAVDQLVSSPFERIDEPIRVLHSYPLLGRSILLDRLAQEHSQEVKTKCELALLTSMPELLSSLKQQLLNPDISKECFTAIKRTFAELDMTADDEASQVVMHEHDSERYIRGLLACSASVQLEHCRSDRRKAARNIANQPSRDLSWIREHLGVALINEIRDELMEVFQDERTNSNQRLVLSSILAGLPDDRRGESTRTALLLTAESKESFDDVFKEIRNRPASLNALVSLLKIRVNLRTQLPPDASSEMKANRKKDDEEISRMWRDAGFNSDFVDARRDEIASTGYIALAMADQFEPLWSLLGDDKDKSAISIRSNVVHQLSKFGVPRRKLIDRLLDQILNNRGEYHEFEVASLLLAIGNYLEPLEQSEKQELVEAIASRLSNAQSSYVLSAAEWLFKNYGIPIVLARAQAGLSAVNGESQKWEINKFGQRFVLVDPAQAQFKNLIERRGQSTVAEKILVPESAPLQPFLFGIHEVTVSQWKSFKDSRGEPFELPKNRFGNEIYPVPADNCPIGKVLRQDALEYCNWLSHEHGLVPVYIPRNGVNFLEGFTISGTQGYRLPLDYEWEIASRAGSSMRRFYGGSDALLSQYAYCNKPPQTGKYAEVGTVMPNSLGIFDTLGNAMEWCHNAELLVAKKNSLEGMHLRGAAYLIFPSNIDHKATKERKIDDKVGDWVDGIRLVRWIDKPAKAAIQEKADR